MQSTTCLHDGVPTALLQEVDRVFDHPIAFPPANGVFNTDADRRDRTIGRLRRWGEFTPTRFFLRWDEDDTVESKALEAPLLGEAAARGPGGARQIRKAFIRRLAFIVC
jgi:hypothetical protein